MINQINLNVNPVVWKSKRQGSTAFTPGLRNDPQTGSGLTEPDETCI